MDSQSQSVWDALYNDLDEASDLKKRSDYLILIWARLNGQSGSQADKAKQTKLSSSDYQVIKYVI